MSRASFSDIALTGAPQFPDSPASISASTSAPLLLISDPHYVSAAESGAPFLASSTSGGSAWRRACDSVIDACSPVATIRVLFLVLLGSVVACLATLSGYVALRSVPMRLSAEESSATTFGSFFIWMTLTLLLTALSVFLASNSIGFFDNRRDEEERTGTTMYERWSNAARLFCTRNGMRHLLSAFDAMSESFFDEADTSFRKSALALSSASASASASSADSSALSSSASASSAASLADRSEQLESQSGAADAVATMLADVRTEEAAARSDRDSGAFTLDEMAERSVTRRRLREAISEHARHRTRAVVGTGLPEVWMGSIIGPKFKWHLLVPVEFVFDENQVLSRV